MKVRFPRFDDRSIWLQVTVTVVIGLLATLALIFAPDSIQVCALVILTPALIYTKALPIIGVVVVTHMVYLMAGLVLAFRSRLEGARIFLWVSVITLVTVINDFLYYSELSPVGNTSPLGLLVFTIAQMTLISARFTRTAANEERIARELQEANAMLTGMNTNLEKLVQERTQALSVAHEDLRTSYDKLLQSEQGRKKLLAYITHDLRMPLSSMLGYVEAVRDMVKPERNEQYLRYIRDNTIRIHRMIEELSFLSHLETGQISYRMEKVRVARFLRDFHGQYELVVRDAGLDFVLDCGEEAPGGHAPVVEMDVQRLEQALFNLVSNAMKFTACGGSIRLTLRIEEVRGTRYAVVGVEDTGIGIPPDQLERIFERNYRYDRPQVGEWPDRQRPGAGDLPGDRDREWRHDQGGERRCDGSVLHDLPSMRSGSLIG